MAVGNRVRARRVAAGISLEKLARMCGGIHANSIRGLEDGFALSPLLLVDVADALDCTLDDLVPVDWEKAMDAGEP
jgi:transcriptional regulator with XRE-family HTH domain